MTKSGFSSRMTYTGGEQATKHFSCTQRSSSGTGANEASGSMAVSLHVS